MEKDPILARVFAVAMDSTPRHSRYQRRVVSLCGAAGSSVHRTGLTRSLNTDAMGRLQVKVRDIK